jgi:hypothetical protein
LADQKPPLVQGGFLRRAAVWIIAFVIAFIVYYVLRNMLGLF